VSRALSPPDDGFSLKRVQEMLGLSRTVVAGLVAAGFVTPRRGPRNEQRFSFQELLLLRTAHALQRAAIPPRRILGALGQLAQTLPEQLPLTGLRITAVGSEVAVHDGGSAWNPETRQVLMDFDVAPVKGGLAFLAREAASASHDAEGDADADGWFRRGEAAEPTDEHAAEHAYRQAIALDGGHANAYVNLGAMLCEAGRCTEAVSLYDQALAQGAASVALHFNHAIALEDVGLYHQAVDSYERVLALDPAYGDAHYNAGMLHDKMGNRQKALAHLSAYRRLQQG